MSRLKDPREHDDFLNYRIKRLLTLGAAPAIRLCEGRYGVARMEWRLVAALHEDGAMPLGKLVLRSGIDQARVSRAVARMVEHGFMQRRPDEDAGRRMVVCLTDAGHSLYLELFPQLAAINRRLMEALDETEALALEDYLQRLTQRALEIHHSGGGVEERTERRLGGSQRHWRRHGARSSVPGAA